MKNPLVISFFCFLQFFCPLYSVVKPIKEDNKKTLLFLMALRNKKKVREVLYRLGKTESCTPRNGAPDNTLAERLATAMQGTVRRMAEGINAAGSQFPFPGNVKQGPSSTPRAAVQEREEVTRKPIVDLAGRYSFEFELTIRNGVRVTCAFTHKDQGPISNASLFMGDPKQTSYSIDGNGHYWINLLSRQNDHVFQYFLIKATDADLMILANRAPYLLGVKEIRTCLLTTPLEIPGELLAKWVPLLHDELLFKVLLSEHAPSYVGHSVVQKRCFVSSFVQSYLWKLSNTALLKLMKSKPKEFGTILPALLMRIDDNRMLEILKQEGGEEILFYPSAKARCLTTRFADSLCKLNSSKLASLLDQFPDEASLLIPAIIKKLPIDGFLIRVLYSRKDLWRHCDVEKHIMALFKKLPSLKVTQIEKEHLYEMGQVISSLKEIDPEIMRLLEGVDIDIFKLGPCLKTDAQWDLFKRTVGLYAQGIRSYDGYSARVGYGAVMRESVTRGLGDFVGVVAESIKEASLEKAHELQARFADICSFLKGVGTAVKDKAGSVITGAAVGSALVMLGSAAGEVIPGADLATYIGLFLLSSCGGYQVIRDDLKNVSKAYKSGEPFEIGQMSTSLAINSVFIARGLRGLSSFLKGFVSKEVSLAAYKDVKMVIKNGVADKGMVNAKSSSKIKGGSGQKVIPAKEPCLYSGNTIKHFPELVIKGDDAREHLFKPKHRLSELGLKEDTLLQTFVDTLTAADGAHRLKLGSNQIVTKINGKTTTVRCFINAEGTVQSVDSFVGTSERTLGNFIDMEKING